MDFGLDIFSGICELLLGFVVFIIELLFYLVEAAICGVLWLFKYSKPTAGAPRWKKVPERTRFFIRSCMHTTLALCLLSLVIYAGFMRKPAKTSASRPSTPSPPAKIEQARKVFDKARQIKETLLPPKPQP